MSEENINKVREISRRKFLRDAGLVVGGTAVGSALLLTACSKEVEVTKTSTITTTTTNKESYAKAKFVIDYDSNKCVGCGACQYFCSTYHEGAAAPSLSRITLERSVPDLTFITETCKQCVAPSCMEVCEIEGAIYIDEETGARIIDEEKCIGCGLCAIACPFNENGSIIKKDPSDQFRFIKCDLCKGREGGPACVEACGWGALSLKAL